MYLSHCTFPCCSYAEASIIIFLSLSLFLLVTENNLQWQLEGQGSEIAPDMKSVKGRRTHIKPTRRDSSGSSSSTSLKRRMSLTYQVWETAWLRGRRERERLGAPRPQTKKPSLV